MFARSIRKEDLKRKRIQIKAKKDQPLAYLSCWLPKYREKKN